MNRCQQNFDNHLIHETLKQLNIYASQQFDDIKEDEIQERRNAEYTNLCKKLDERAQEEIKNTIEKSEYALLSHQRSFENQIKAIVDDSNDKHQTISELYELTTSDSVGARYTKNANEKMKQADKWFTLEAKAFNPFVNSLKEEQQHELKNQLSEKLFGQNEYNNTKESNIINEYVFKAIIDGIVNIISKIQKPTRCLFVMTKI